MRVWDGVLFWGVRGRDAGIWCQAWDDFAAEIEAAVGACSILLALTGPQWLSPAMISGPALSLSGFVYVGFVYVRNVVSRA